MLAVISEKAQLQEVSTKKLFFLHFFRLVGSEISNKHAGIGGRFLWNGIRFPFNLKFEK